MGTDADSQGVTCSGSDASHPPLPPLASQEVLGARLGPLLELTVLRSGVWVLGKAPREESSSSSSS